MAKTKKEILDYCKNYCNTKNCKGKFLRKARKDRGFVGFTHVKKGEWYCSKK